MADKSTNSIPCMLIPLQQHYVLLPKTAITEVIPMPKLSSVANKPNYWVGQYDWNSWLLPVLDLESLVQEKPADIELANKICILHGINPEAQIDVYAIACYGAAQLININEAALKLALDVEDSDFLHCQIKIGSKIAYIPNLDTIEATISQQ